MTSKMINSFTRAFSLYIIHPSKQLLLRSLTHSLQACAQMQAGTIKCKCKRRIKCKCKCSAPESHANSNVQQLNQMQMHLNQMHLDQMQMLFYNYVFLRSASDILLIYLVTTILIKKPNQYLIIIIK